MNASTTQKMQNLSQALRALAEAFDALTETSEAKPSAEQPRSNGNGHRAVPTCPECQAPMKARTSARGPFWGCSNYPHCTAVRKIGAENMTRNHHGESWRQANRSAQIEAGRDD